MKAASVAACLIVENLIFRQRAGASKTRPPATLGRPAGRAIFVSAWERA
jgi:hypothetical protein